MYDLLQLKVTSHINLSTVTIHDSFTDILNLNNIPDISKLYLDGFLDINKILKLRYHKDCIQFRSWIDDLTNIRRVDREDVIKAYHSACVSEGKIEKVFNSKYYKGLNVATSIGIGFIPILSGIYAVFDNFKDLFIKDWKPNSFINKIRNLY